jgi:CBS domain-containing protein
MAEVSPASTPPADTPVREVMSPGVIALPDDTTIGACARAMYERRTHAVLIVGGDRQPRGWIFHLDILRHLQSDPLTTLAGDAVSQEAAVIDSEATVEEAAERMVSENLTHLLVAKSRGSIPDGVLSSWDVVAFYARFYGHSM